MSATGTPIFHGTYGEIAEALASRIASQRAGSRLGETVEIIVPSRSAAEEIARRVVGDGGAIAGLQMLQIEQFALRVLNGAGRYPRVPDGAESALAMELALRAAGGELATIHGAAAMLLRTHRDLRDSGLTLAEISKRITKQKGLRNRDRLASGIAVWKRYESLLADAGATVEADVLAEASTRIRDGARVAPQIIFGFYDATAVQLDLLRALIATRHAESIWLPTPLDVESARPKAPWSYAASFIDVLTAEGVSIAERAAPSTLEAEWEIRDQPSPMLEIREVCRTIRSLVDRGVAGSSIAVVMRSADAAVLSLFEQTGRDFGLTFRGVPGRPVIGNRIVRGVLAILRLARGGMARREVMEVVRSGLRQGALGSPPELVRLERATRKAKIGRAGAAEVRAIARAEQSERERAEPDSDLLGYASLVERLASITKKASSPQRGSSWADDVERWAGLFEAETEDDIDAVVRVRRIAELFRRAPFAAARLDADDVRHAIEDAGELARDEDAAAIWIGDVMRFRGRTTEELFVVRATNDNLPQRRVDDPLLPDFDRTRLGVRIVGDGREEERFLFASLVASARSMVRFSFSTADGVGKALRPSSMLKDLALERAPSARREILHDFRKWLRGRNSPTFGPPSAIEQKSASLLESRDARFVRQLQLAATHGGTTQFDGYLGASPEVELRLRAIFASTSPSSIEQLGECPQRFLMSTLLGARELEEPDAGIAIESREKGTLDHVILERFYSGLAASDFAAASGGELPTALRGRLAAQVDRAFEELNAAAPPPNRTLRTIERTETFATLADFVRSDMRQLAEGNWLPHEHELVIESGEEAARIDVAGVRVGVRGRIDRVDRGTDGSWRVVDYKSNKASHLKGLDGKVAEGAKLQTAIYALVAKRRFGVDAEKVSARIMPLRNPEADATKFGFNLAAVEADLESVLGTLVGSAIAGRFPAVPSSEACKYCLVRNWCREKHEPSDDDASVLEILRRDRA
ncbi:MAG: PD-(D/E)XK nuclease family protein [Thermoanaerobaculia bacterium]|nr:PD-(D/E)XK nuclease family protein [Thermoanaerobaculia bacterium]